MTADPSVKPIPKVVSFQDPLPEPHRYRPQADRILSGYCQRVSFSRGAGEHAAEEARCVQICVQTQRNRGCLGNARGYRLCGCMGCRGMAPLVHQRPREYN